MMRKVVLIIVAAVLALMSFAAALPATAQEAPRAYTEIETNLRTGPGTKYEAIITLAKGLTVYIEGRNADSSWILIRTENAIRGWSKTRLLRIDENVQLRLIPESTEILNANTAVPPAVAPIDPKVPNVSGTAKLDASVVAQITPGIRSAMRAVALKGKKLGNNMHAFSKVGDCMTDHPTYLNPFGYGSYSLGQYGYLQEVINYFNVPPREGVGNSWDARSFAAHNGFNSSAVFELQWADRSVCEQNEGPLACELRVNKPAVAIIMFGAADVLVMSPAQFYTFMKKIIKDTMDAGTIPLLSTFPENPAAPEASRKVNQMVVSLARAYNLPMMNLADAVRALPNGGLESDGIHLSIPPGSGGDFNDDTLKFGYTVRNLITLQSLDLIMRQILAGL